MQKNVFPMSLLFFVILYSAWHCVWHRMSLHNYVTLGTASRSLKNNLKFPKNRDIFSDSFTILAYGSWDSLFPISMSPNCKLMSPKHYF